MKPVVIDLSHHNVIPSSLRPARHAGIIGCIHKATEGTTYLDDKAAARHALAEDADMLWGLYHFIRPGKITAQADFFLSQAALLGDDRTLLALDWEDSNVPAEYALAFLDYVQNRSGRAPVLYSGHVCKEDPHDGFAPYRLWLAQYGSSCTLPAFANEYWLWQYTDAGTVPGVTPPTDLNHYDGPVEQLMAEWSGGEDVGPLPAMPVVSVIISAPAGVKVEVQVIEDDAD